MSFLVSWVFDGVSENFQIQDISYCIHDLDHSICVNFFYVYKQCNFLVQKQSTCKSLKGKSMQLFSYFRKSTEGFAVLLQLCVKVHLLMTCFAN